VSLRTPTPRVTVSTYFVITGFLSAGWIARIPALTEKLDLDTAQLGSLLLFIAIGSIAAFQIIGRTIERWGSGRSTVVFCTAYCLALSAIALAPNSLTLAIGLFVYGFSFGATDVAMNAQGVTVERALRRKIMGSLHGYFSLGALVGAAVSSGLASLEIRIEPNLVAFTVLGLIATFWAYPGHLEDEPQVSALKEERSRFSLPPRPLWAMGVIAFCGAVGEGSMADWGALYVNDELGGSEGLAALAFTAFSTTAVIGRFATDWVVVKFGAARVVAIGAVIGAAGLVLGLLLHSIIGAIVGFAVMGAGIAAVFPVVYSAAGSMPGIGSGRGVAAVATMGYSGFLAGPPVLGFLARETSIRWSLLMVAALIAAIVFFTSTLKRAEQPGASALES
jgi:MFS family permease